jgi:hypothetical protein
VLSWLGWCGECGYDGPEMPIWAKRLTPPDSKTPARSKMAADRLIARRDVHLREKTYAKPVLTGQPWHLNAGFLRLDCMRSNDWLRAHYRERGFAHRGDVAVTGAPGRCDKETDHLGQPLRTTVLGRAKRCQNHALA